MATNLFTYISSAAPPPGNSIALSARFGDAALYCLEMEVRRMLMFVLICDILMFIFDGFRMESIFSRSFNMRCNSFRSLFKRSKSARCFFFIIVISAVRPLSLSFCFCNSNHAICPLNRSTNAFSRIFSNDAKSSLLRVSDFSSWSHFEIILNN